MIKPIVHDIFFLGQPSDSATKEDIPVAKDLLDTLAANWSRASPFMPR